MGNEKGLLHRLHYISDLDAKTEIETPLNVSFLDTPIYQEVYGALSELGFQVSATSHPMLIMYHPDPPRPNTKAFIVGAGYATHSEPLWPSMKMVGKGDLLLQCVGESLEEDIVAVGHYSPADDIDLKGRLGRLMQDCTHST